MNNQVFAAIQNRDAGALAQYLPKDNQRVVNPLAEKLVDQLFLNLAQIFSTGRRTPEETGAMKQQWIMAFAENGITTKAQIAAGMRIARQQYTDFWPSCGKFIGWCKEAYSTAAGLPSLDDALAEFERYCANRDRYESAEAFPWSSPVLYWIVLDVRRAMYRYNHTEAETKKALQAQLTRWTKKIAAGETVPTPAAQIENKTRAPSTAELMDKDGEYQRKGAELLAMIRAKQKGATL
ncbi:replication protein P [Serratia sp. DD3]|uniref:replication protein P n=1 Tax=Serratia sp. DD3 TaxID=1410619 RepID=UPI0003C52687|nr:replication protein P [Serratia sp. DD3]KEY58476.1 replication protein P [Serratia sp. DD3]